MEISCRNRGFQSEAGNLGQGVNAGVGSPRTLRQHNFAGDAMDCLGQSSLDGGKVWLHLPSAIGGAVVAEEDFPLGHG